MSVYTETVELLTPGRRIFVRLLAAAGLALLVYFAAAKDSPGEILALLVSYFHLVAGVAGVILLAFSDELTVEITGEHVLLRMGLFRKRYPLRNISRAKSTILEPKSKSWFSLEGWRPSFVSQVVATGVELGFFDGKTQSFSSNNPDHLAALILQQAALAHREAALRQVRTSR